MRVDGSAHPVVVIGGGQAGLSMSHCLTRLGVGHVVLERGRVGESWRSRRWDSFCLVTPNWQCDLPGHPYAGGDPDGFMVREEIVAYLEGYAASFAPPVVEHVTATRLTAVEGGFAVTTDRGVLTAGQVVVATGPYQTPVVPRVAERLTVPSLHSDAYRAPDGLPDGPVLVVGSGQSGCQIAEDLFLAGRTVHLAVGTAPRVARRYRGRDVVEWLDLMGHYDRPITEFDDPEAVRARANHYVTGRDGGRDIDLRAFALQGMRLHGRLTGITGGRLHFADDLAANLDHADAVSEGVQDSVDAYIASNGISAPAGERYVPVWRPPAGTSTVREEEIAAVVWCTGFRRDHSWIRVPVFDGTGYPAHTRGVTRWPGLYFLGLPWLHTWGSGRIVGVGRDAEHLAGHVSAHLAGQAPAASGYHVHPELLGT